MASPLARWIGFLGTAAFNAAIAVSGNYGHLHILTVTNALSIIAEPWCGGKAAALSAGGAASSSWTQVTCPPPPSSWLGYGASWVAWALGIYAGLAYFAVSLVPFCANFDGLLSIDVDVPGWEALERAFSVAQRWHYVGECNECRQRSKRGKEQSITVAKTNGA